MKDFEFWLIVIAILALGWATCEFYWTVLKSDAAAAAHFAKSNMKSLLKFVLLGIVAFIAITGWTYVVILWKYIQ